MPKYKPTGLTHNIVTIKELFAVATPANINYILRDLKATFKAGFAIDDLCLSVAKDVGYEHKKIELTEFNWTDDGLNELTEIVMTDRDGSGKSLKIDKNGCR